MKIEARERLTALIRQSRGNMSQRAYARLLGVSSTAVQDWEKGAVIPDTENLSKIAATSGYTFGELMDYLQNGHTPRATDFERILKRIQLLPPEQVAEIARVAQDRLVSVALGN